MKTADLLKTTITAVRSEANGHRFKHGYSPRLFAITLLEHEYNIILPKHTVAQIVIDAMQGILDFNGIPA